MTSTEPLKPPCAQEEHRQNTGRSSVKRHCCIWAWVARCRRLPAQGQIAKASSVTRPRLAVGWFVDRELVVAPSQIPYEVMPGDRDPGTAVPLAPSHRSQPRLEAAVVALDAVVGGLFGSMPRRRSELLRHGRGNRRTVGDDLDRPARRGADGGLEAAAGGARVAPYRHHYVNDLAELVECTVDIPPRAGDLGSVSSACQRSPTACRHGRTASASSGVRCWTHR